MIVLFVCSGNTCRSPMAEGILNSMAKGRLSAFSRGTCAADGDPASDLAIKTMRKIGVDISNHCARRLAPDDLSKASIVVAMDPWIEDALIREFNQLPDETWSIKDPIGGTLETYIETGRKLEEAVKSLIARLGSMQE